MKKRPFKTSNLLIIFLFTSVLTISILTNKSSGRMFIYKVKCRITLINSN